MPRGRGRIWGFTKRWKSGGDVVPAPPGPLPVVVVTTPSWYHTAPAAGSSVIILPALRTQSSLPPDASAPPSPPSAPSAPPSPPLHSSTPVSPPPAPSAPEQPPTQQPPPPPPVKPPDAKALDVKLLDTLAVPSGRASQLSTVTVAAPVRCVCAFVADRVCRHCAADCRRRRCDFAAAKTVGYCGLPTLVLAWGAFWVLLLLGLGGVLTAPALAGS